MKILEILESVSKNKEVTESLKPGEYHLADVTFNDNTKTTVKITSDEGFREQIVNYFKKQGKTVADINVDYSVRGFPDY